MNGHDRDLWLSRHAYLCRIEQQVVVLDLQRDRYLGLDALTLDSLSDRVHGWKTKDRDTCRPRDSGNNQPRTEQTLEILTSLLGCGILTSDATRGKPATPITLERPQRSLIDGYEEVTAGARASDLVRFMASAITARCLLRCCSLERIATRVARLRRIVRAAEIDLNQEKARRCVATFTRLRPLLFTSYDACLFDSLALLEFLAHDGFLPQWVFGVRINPFGAHCWLQHGSVVMNDTPEHVRIYTPLMAL